MVDGHRLALNMGLNPRLYEFIRALNTHALSKLELACLLASNGYLNSKNETYSEKQISSILHSVVTIEKALAYHPVDRCGIDRSKNPCGDASEY